MTSPPSRRAVASGAPPRAVPPRRPAPLDLDPVPFPGGAEAALEFAAFEKGLLERGSGREPPVERHAPVSQHASISQHTPISEPDRHSLWWMLAGAGLAMAAAILLLLLSSGLLATGFATVLRTVMPP